MPGGVYAKTHVRLIQPPGRATQRLRKIGGAVVTAGAANLVLRTTWVLLALQKSGIGVRLRGSVQESR